MIEQAQLQLALAGGGIQRVEIDEVGWGAPTGAAPTSISAD
jgi:hypothetical protein